MLRELMKSKIHRATVTDAHLDYVGSLTLDRDLMEAVDLLADEKVHVVNINTAMIVVARIRMLLRKRLIGTPRRARKRPRNNISNYAVDARLFHGLWIV